MHISNRDRVLMVIGATYFLLVTAFSIRNGYDFLDTVRTIILYGAMPVVAVWALIHKGAAIQILMAISIVWLVLVFYFTTIENAAYRTTLADLILIGILPLVLIWGGRWIAFANRQAD